MQHAEMSENTSKGCNRPFTSNRGRLSRNIKSGDHENTEESSTSIEVKEKFDPEIQMFFQSCSKSLDIHHDRHERLVKMSRDITVDSKRVIFLLHRIHDEDSLEKLCNEAEAKLNAIINNIWKRVATEIKGQDPHRYLRAYTPGMQEFIEALTLLHYIQAGSLMTLEEIQMKLQFSEDLLVTVPIHEYLLGIADLTGELMRMCINAVGRGDVDTCFETCAFLRKIHDALSSLNINFQRELKRKLQVSRQSLQKVETACYTVQVRGSEIPKEALQLLASQAAMIEDNPTWSEDFD